MNALAKLNFKTVTKTNTRDPVIARREKLVAGLKEQKLVFAAALEGKDHRVERYKWMNNEHGERVSVQTHRRVRPWFFEQDGGWYVQCRYGADPNRPLFESQKGGHFSANTMCQLFLDIYKAVGFKVSLPH